MTDAERRRRPDVLNIERMLEHCKSMVEKTFELYDALWQMQLGIGNREDYRWGLEWVESNEPSNRRTVDEFESRWLFGERDEVVAGVVPTRGIQVEWCVLADHLGDALMLTNLIHDDRKLVTSIQDGPYDRNRLAVDVNEWEAYLTKLETAHSRPKPTTASQVHATAWNMQHSIGWCMQRVYALCVTVYAEKAEKEAKARDPPRFGRGCRAMFTALQMVEPYVTVALKGAAAARRLAESELVGYEAKIDAIARALEWKALALLEEELPVAHSMDASAEQQLRARIQKIRDTYLQATKESDLRVLETETASVN
jgi:hypothetical protein